MLEEESFIEEKGIDWTEEQQARALLVGTYSGGSQRAACEEYLDELKNLADTFGVETAAFYPCAVKKIDAATFIPSGKLAELKKALLDQQARLVIFDEEISPAQQRNLEKELQAAVMDRTELILEIFAQRAQTKEARLQIELAKTKYEFPRLKRMWSHFSRQRASGGYLKGEGEKQIEIDRRLLKKKLERLSDELKEVKRYRETQRVARKRSGIPTFAIVGYTNAGKSTLLNALTEAGVLVEDKLFATLDPTTRKFVLPNNQEVLLTDTVGFIRKLPHTLVAAFRSTLEAALHDDVLLHIIDASHPLAEEHALTTLSLLKELGAGEENVITLLNKADRCENPEKLKHLQARFPKSVVVSALHKTGFETLVTLMMRELAQRRQILKLKIPQSAYALVAQLRKEGNVLHEEYEGNDVLVRAEVPLTLAHRYEAYKHEESENPASS